MINVLIVDDNEKMAQILKSAIDSQTAFEVKAMDQMGRLELNSLMSLNLK